MATTAPFISKEDVDALRSYVMGSTGQNRAESTVLLHVSHSNLQARFFELRLDRHMTIEALKVKLSFHVGTPPSAQLLQLLTDSGALVSGCLDDSRKLGFYSPQDGWTLHIVDLDPSSASAGGWLEDTSLVDKYRMSDEEYNKRENSYRKWKESKLKADPNWTLEREMAARRGAPLPQPKAVTTDADAFSAEAAAITVGSRCSVAPGDRRGTVRFVGRDVAGLPVGWWVGVQYDEPVGKNDGMVGGKRLFTCPPGYGGFARPDKVTVGDFPEAGDDLDSALGSEDEI